MFIGYKWTSALRFFEKGKKIFQEIWGGFLKNENFYRTSEKFRVKYFILKRFKEFAREVAVLKPICELFFSCILMTDN